MKRYNTLALLFAATSIIALAPPRHVAAQSIANQSAARREATPELRRRTFEIVWRTIKEKHFDPKFNGVDWDKVHDVYAPRIAHVKNDKEPKEGSTGVQVRILDDEVVIWRIDPNSTGARAGLKPGFVIKQLDNRTIEQISAPIRKRKESPDAIRARITDQIAEELLAGELGSSLRIVYLDESDRAHDVTIKREKPSGEMSPNIGDFPSFYTEFESKRLADNIGYIRFNIFLPLFNQRIRAAIRSMSDAPGLIIDLRGNPGGFDGVGQGLAGLLVDKQISLGTSRMRKGFENYVVYPQKSPYLGPIVVLVDCMSGSASESFAGGMQSIGRAVVVGEKSGGGDLGASIDTLPTGALLLYAYADFVTAKGVSLEGRGVIPDIEVKLTRASLLAGGDPQLEAAINYIKKQSGRQK